MQACADSGMRATATLEQPNVRETDKYPFPADILPPELRQRLDGAPRMSSAELIAHYVHLIGRWNGAEGGRLGAGVSCSAPQRVTPDYLAALGELSRKDDLPFVVHILETKLQRVLGAETFGKSLVRLVHDLGFLDERMQIVHGIWIDDEDAIKRDARDLAGALASDSGAAEMAAAELMPCYREMYLRAMANGVGLERRAPPRR